MKIFGFMMKLILTVFFLYLALRSISVSSWRQVFLTLSPQVLILLTLIVMLQVFVLAYRWKYLISAASENKIPFLHCTASMLISFFFSQGLPASIGGDAFRAWWMIKNGVDSGSSMKIIVLDRIYGLIALAIACTSSVSYFLLFQNAKNIQMLSLAAIIFFVGILLAFLVIPKRFRFFSILLPSKVHFPIGLQKIIHWVVKIHNSLNRLTGLQSMILIGSSFLIHCFVILQAYCIGAILCPEKITLVFCAVAVPPALFVSYMPFSIAGWGVREASMVMAFGLLGVDAATALLISVAIGIAVLCVSFLGGVLWLTGYRKQHPAYLKKKVVP